MFGMDIGKFTRLFITTVIAAWIGAPLQTEAAPTKFGAWLVVDAKSGQVLGSHNPNRPWYPASLTKLMTAYVTFQAITEGRRSLKSAVRVSQNALSEPPSKMGFKVGTIMTIDNALKMVIVKSANDIAVALAEAVGGKEERFIAEMNRTARRLGMSHTNFVNPHGLPHPRQVTSARDMAILGRALFRDFPQYRHYFRIQAIRHGRRVLRSHNPLLTRFSGANGMKTGFICNSGLNLVGSATRSGRTLISVVLGARSGIERAVVSKTLIERGFAGRFQAGKTTMAALKRTAKRGTLPPNRYCKKVKRPTGDELEAAYGKRSRFSSFFASSGTSMRYAEGDRGGSIVVPSAERKHKKGRKRKKKRDLYALLVGPQIRVTKPVRVYLGLPSNPRVTRVVPTPLRKPKNRR